MKVISVRDLQEMVRNGQGVSIPEDALVTPAARDFLNELESSDGPKAAIVRNHSGSNSASGGASHGAPLAPPAGKLSSKSPKSELEAFFNSPYAHSLKEQICEMGHRLWKREYVDGNGGNMAIRVGEDIAICTPTLVSKGSLKPEDLCLVDFEGNQLLGTKKRTSEILMHLQMMKRQPQALATCHCHPPYATAFAIVGMAPPTCMLPEYEVFCAVGVAPYRTPGSPDMGKLVAELTGQYNTILMANHGVVSWSHNSIEEAYWRMEIVEAYCRTIVVAGQLGKPINTFTGPQMKELLNIKQSLGFVDPRYGMKECELCDSGEWRPGVTCQAESNSEPTVGLDPDAEAAVKAITDEILARIK
ncbi:MAG TPA: class II aldolase/adducin family protein [Candidatus Acidoferrales bacterium]|nr:class II aldolase/adducin family protein [Candidatus Acidoferrales bacterium]